MTSPTDPRPVNWAGRVALALAAVAVGLPVLIALFGGLQDATKPPTAAPSIGDGLGLLFGAIIGLGMAWIPALAAVVVGIVSLRSAPRRPGIIALCIAVPLAALSLVLARQF